MHVWLKPRERGEDSIKEKEGWAETESGQRKRRQGTVSYLLLLELIMSDGTGSVKHMI